MSPRVNEDRLLGRLEELSAIGRDPGGGITRLAWSPELVAATKLVANWAREAGASVRLDGAGNLIAEIPGEVTESLPLVTGSHLDSVIGAGSLDGAYGVVAGIEVLACLAEQGLRLSHPLRVVAYANEEGVVAPPFTGSRALAGVFDDSELSWVGPDGISLATRLAGAGCDPAGPVASAWEEPLGAVIELHVEQGPVLDSLGVPVGVVTAITGQRRGTVEIAGSANHAGTTPMSLRHDALVAAAQVILAVRDLAVAGPADVATVGRMSVGPNVANVIAASVSLTFDIRSTDEGLADQAVEILARHLVEIATSTCTDIVTKPLPPTPAVATDVSLQAVIARVARDLGLREHFLPSGAGHDTGIIACRGPAAMIFVPSQAGLSHHPSEWTDPRYLVGGANVLLGSLIQCDREIDA